MPNIMRILSQKINKIYIQFTWFPEIARIFKS